MILSLIKYELYFQSRHLLFYAVAIVFLFFGYMLGSQGFAQQQLNFNSGYQIVYNISILSLGFVFGIMLFAVKSCLRDSQYKMSSIIFSTPLHKRHFFISRFISVYLSSVLVISFCLIGLWIGFRSGRIDPSRIVDFNLSHYFFTFLFTIIPTVFICSVFIFSISLLTQSSMATYATAIGIYAAYFISSIYFNSPLLANSSPPSAEGMTIAALCDPLGISAFFEVTQYWTPFEKNTNMISLFSSYGLNRLIWICISFAVLLLTYYKFDFTTEKKDSKRPNQPVLKVHRCYDPIDLNIKTSLTEKFKLLSLLKIECLSVFKSIPFVLILAFWMFAVFMELYATIYQSGEYGEMLYLKTSMLLEIIDEPFFMTGLILVVFFSGENLWRDREKNMHLVINSLPVSNAILFFGKYLTVLLIPVFFLTAAFLMAIILQLIEGGVDLELRLYLERYYFSTTKFVFFTSLAFFIFNFIPSKLIGMLVSTLLLLLFSSSLIHMLNIFHHLLILGRVPNFIYSDMIGYGDFSWPFHCYTILWTSFAFVLNWFGLRLWHRNLEFSVKSKVIDLFQNWKRSEILIVSIATIIFIIMAGYIYYNTNILNDYGTPEDRLELQASYERNFKKYDKETQLIPVDINMDFDFYPSIREYKTNGQLVLRNNSSEPVDTIMVSERDETQTLEIEGGKLILHDSIHHVRIFTFDPVILPGDSITYSFEIQKRIKGFRTSNSIVKNASYIQLRSFIPNFSYINSYEIEDNFERSKRGLPVKEEAHDNDGHMHISHFQKVNFEAIVSTELGQFAFAPGDRLKSWENDNRQFAHYKFPLPSTLAIVFASGEYDLVSENYNNVEFEQYFAKGQGRNVKRMQEFSKMTMDYCEENIGAYPFERLTTIEIPRYWNFGGQALPGLISMVEDRMYQINVDSTSHFDLVAKRVIHEVAHQWWGHLFSPKNIPGGDLLVEGLAKYTEAVVMNKVYGPRSFYQLCHTANKRYFNGRAYSTKSEDPLYQNEEHAYLSYGKSLLSIMSLYQLIGEYKVNQALKEVFDKHKTEILPSASALDLLDAFYNVTPLAYHKLIDEWFKEIVIYDLAIENVKSKQLESGKYELEIDVKASRKKVMSDGSTIDVGINEPIQIGIFNTHPKYIKQEDIIYLKSHTISDGYTKIKIIVDRIPTFISVDPFAFRPDKKLLDNLIRI